jgi:hypothetical protein
LTRILLAFLAVFLAGCGSIFDPAPYNPLNDNTVLTSVSPPATAATILTFDDTPPGARPKLQALANGYANQRDDLMRQQLLFDVPMIGLGVAAIVNPLFDGAKNVTLGLSLGAAAAAGGRIYFGPQAKVTAYNTAWLSLTCASLVADSIAAEKAADLGDGFALAETLAGQLSAAEGSLSGNPLLLAAYNQGQKSLGALQTALATLSAANIQLEQYGLTVISTATNKVLANVQNVPAVTAAVAAAARPAPSGAPAAALSFKTSPAPKPTTTQLTLNLQNSAAKADAISQRINTVMGALPKCTPT